MDLRVDFPQRPTVEEQRQFRAKGGSDHDHGDDVEVAGFLRVAVFVLGCALRELGDGKCNYDP